MLTAIRLARNAATLPGLDVNRPPFAPGFVLEMFWTHRRFSNAAENPKWNENTLSKSGAGLGRLRREGGRLFKSGFEKPVHGDKRTVAESGAWCNDLGGRWHKGE